MEPVTHILTGACLARTGLNRKAAYVTLTMAVAAEFPDIDTLWELRGPIEGLQHHRGITHTFLGLPFEAAFVVGAVFLLHKRRKAHPRVKRKIRQTSSHSAADDHEIVARPLTAAPVRWGVLYGCALLALLSHLLLDYTNNYGLRPFFPFNPRWYAGSIVFIFDPLIFLLLLAACVLPAIFRLVSREVGARSTSFAPRGWAAAALLGIVCVWAIRTVEHSRALSLARAETAVWATPDSQSAAPPSDPSDHSSPGSAPTVADLPAIRLEPRRTGGPDPFSPFRWHVANDFGPFIRLAEVDTREGSLVPDGAVYAKPQPSAALTVAENSYLGRTFLDWSAMPILTVSAGPAANGDGATPTIVSFEDARFLDAGSLFHSEEERSPLSGRGDGELPRRRCPTMAGRPNRTPTLGPARDGDVDGARLRPAPVRAGDYGPARDF